MRPYRILSSRSALLTGLSPTSIPKQTLRHRLASTKSSASRAHPVQPPPNPTAQLRSGLTSTWGPLIPRLRTALPLLICLATGLALGTVARNTLLSTPPAHDSPEDLALLAQLDERIDKLFKVQIFRGKCIAAGRAIRGTRDEGGWVEIDTTGSRSGDEGKVRRAELRFEAEKHANREKVVEAERRIVAESEGPGEAPKVGRGAGERIEALRQQAEALGLEFDAGLEQAVEGRFVEGMQGITRGPLGGGRGLGVQRVFWHKDGAELVAVVWLGEALCGWPRVVHGGLLATVLSDKAGMAAALFGDEIGAPRWEDWHALEELDLTYKKPTYAGAFYVVRALPRVVEEGSRRAIEVDSMLETMEGQVCVQARGVVPLSGSGAITASTSWWGKWLPI